MEGVRKFTILVGIIFGGVCSFLGNSFGEMYINSSISISEDYDDNIFRTSENEVYDFKTAMTPNIGILYRWPLVDIGINYRGVLSIYANHPKLNEYNHDGSITINLDRAVGRLSKRAELKITENVIYTPSLPDYSFESELEQNLESEGGILGRNDIFRNEFGISYNYRLSKRTLVLTGYENIITQYTNPQLSDRIQHSGKIGIDYQIGKTDFFLLNFRYQNIKFEKEKGETNTYLGTFGWRHNITATFSFQVDVGYLYIPDLRPKSERVFLSGNLNKVFYLERGTQFKFSYSRDVGTSGLSQRVVENQVVDASMEKKFSDDISGNIKGGYRTSKGLSEGDTLDLEIYRIRTSLIYKITPSLTGSVSYSYSNQTSKGGVGSSIDVNIIQIKLTTIFPTIRGL